MRLSLRRLLSVVGSAMVLAALVVAVPAATPAGAANSLGWTISTFAGSGPPSFPNTTGGFGGDGGPATSALMSPGGASADAHGNVYIADTWNQRIRKVDPSGIITTIAGDGTASYGGDGGPATSAQINYPNHAVADAAGNVYFNDSGNNRVRKVDTSGIITTLAGDGDYGYGGDGGPATAAQLADPQDVAVDSAGNVFIADWANYAIRKVDPSGIISTVAGGTEGFGGDGGPATAAQFENITGVAVDSAGDLYIADVANNRVRKVDTAGIVTTIAGSGDRGYDGDGGPATSASLNGPSSVAVQGSGNVYFADFHNDVVRRVDVGGTIETVAGNGTVGFSGDSGFGPAAQLSEPGFFGLDPAENLYIADENNNRIRKVETSYLWVDAAPKTAKVGDTVTYSFTVAGVPTTTSGVSIKAVLDPAVSFSSAIAPGGACTRSANQVLCPMGTIAPGTAATAQIKVTAAATGVIPITASIASASPAIPGGQAAGSLHKVQAAGCGRVVTADTHLSADLGPCAFRGLIVGADGVTLNLGNHRVYGFPGPGAASDEVGIAVPNHRNVTILNGTVSDFDAGILLNGGGGNQISGMTIRDNVGINDVHAQFGDGIAVFDSDTNLITNNTLAHNGTFDGIAVIGPDAHDNTIRNNVIKDTLGPTSPPGPAGQGIVLNGFDNFPNGDVVKNTTIVGNTITGNGSAGLSLVSVDGAEIARNIVTGNGLTNSTGNGIGVQQFATFNHPATPSNVYLHNNQVHGNGWDGILIKSSGNRIVDNDASDNNVTYHDPSLFDLHDTSSDPTTHEQNCFGNTWSGNIWGSGGFSPACTATGGHVSGSGPGHGPKPHATGNGNGPDPNAQNNMPPSRRTPPAS